MLNEIELDTLRQSEVKPVENISKNSQSFLEISPMQKESFHHVNCKTMQDHAYK